MADTTLDEMEAHIQGEVVAPGLASLEAVRQLQDGTDILTRTAAHKTERIAKAKSMPGHESCAKCLAFKG